METATTITKIQKTKQGRYALFCAVSFLFSITEETLVLEKVQEGSVFTETELFLLKEKSDLRLAKDKALLYISVRNHGKKELLQKLCRKYDEDTAAAAVQAMEDLGLVNDEEFAKSRAAYYIEFGKKSPGEAAAKLRALGIPRQFVDAAVEPFKENGTANAIALLQGQYAGRLARGEGQKVKAALARKGFSHRDIKAAFAALEAEIGETGETEEFYDDMY